MDKAIKLHVSDSRLKELQKKGSIDDLVHYCVNMTGMNTPEYFSTLISGTIAGCKEPRKTILSEYYIQHSSIYEMHFALDRSFSDLEKMIERGTRYVINKVMKGVNDMEDSITRMDDDNTEIEETNKDEEISFETRNHLKELSNYVREVGVENITIVDVFQYVPEMNMNLLNRWMQALSQKDRIAMTSVLRKYQDTSIIVSKEALLEGMYTFHGIVVTNDMKSYILDYMEDKGYPLYLNLFKQLARQMVNGELLIG